MGSCGEVLYCTTNNLFLQITSLQNNRATLLTIQNHGNLKRRNNQYVSITREICDYAPQFSQNVDKKKKKDLDNTPIYSRLFVVCDKDSTEEEVEQLFAIFGKIDYCKAIKDKKSDKGMFYIKYEKTSSAAKALEEMNGKTLSENGAPIKIQIAEPKNAKKKVYSKEPEDTPPRSRLFVVCPKEMTEEILNERFKNFEDLEYCKVITDKVHGDSKGFAYVKFSKASSAATAMEEILTTGFIAGMKIKILIADPKEKRSEQVEMYPPSAPYYMVPYAYPEMPYIHPIPVSNRIEITSHSFIGEDEFEAFLEQFPGFEYKESVPVTSEDEHHRVSSKMHVEFQSVELATLAQHQLDNLEYPPRSGNYIKCTYVPPVHVYHEYPIPGYRNPMFHYPYAPPMYPPPPPYHHPELGYQGYFDPHDQYNRDMANYYAPTWNTWVPYGTSPPNDYRF